MILPNTFDTTPFKLSNLSKRQTSFIAFLYEQGHDNPTEVVFKRNYLKNIANAWGSEWAPAWVVKDVSRVTTRGMYAVPELNDLIALAVANDTPVVEDDAIMADAVHDDMDETIEVSDDIMSSTVVV